MLRTSQPRTVGTSTGALMRRALEEMSRQENRAARATLDALLKKFPDNDVVQYLEAKNDITLGEIESAQHRTIRVPELADLVREALVSSAVKPDAFLVDLNETLKMLSRNALTPEQRTRLDRSTLTSTARFDTATANEGQTILESGTISGVPFRFAQPTAFNGTFASATPLRMTYRILGATELRGANALLVEPVRVEAQ